MNILHGTYVQRWKFNLFLFKVVLKSYCIHCLLQHILIMIMTFISQPELLLLLYFSYFFQHFPLFLKKFVCNVLVGLKRYNRTNVKHFFISRPTLLTFATPISNRSLTNLWYWSIHFEGMLELGSIPHL